MKLLNLDNIAFSDLMRACRQNVKVKNLSEKGEFNTAFELLQRLRQRYYTVDDITKAKHMLNYHALTKADPGWNSQGRLATETPAEKRMRLSQGLPLETKLASEFGPPSKRGGRKRRSCVNTFSSLCSVVSSEL